MTHLSMFCSGDGDSGYPAKSGRAHTLCANHFYDLHKGENIADKSIVQLFDRS